MRKIIRINLKRFIREPNLGFVSFLILFVIAVSTVLLSMNVVEKTYNYNIGEIARENIQSKRDIKYLNESETEMAKTRAKESVPLVFEKDQSVLTESIRNIEEFFTYITRVLKENPPIGTKDRTFQLIVLKDILPVNFNYDDRTLWNILKTENVDRFKRTVRKILIFIFDNGVLEKPFINPIDTNSRNVTIRTINISQDANEVSYRLEDLRTLDQINKDLLKICSSISTDKSRDEVNALYNVVKSELGPNLKFNMEETRRRIDEKVKAVQPVIGILKKGQMIVREGDTITTESLFKINILNQNTASTNVTYVIGILLLQLTIVSISIFINREKDKTIQNKKISFISFSLVMIFIIYTFAISRIEDIYNTGLIFGLLLPIPFVTMTIATLFRDRFIILLVGIFMIFFAFIISLGSFPTLMIAFSSTILGVVVVRNIEKRTDFLFGGLIISFVNTLIIIAVNLMEEFSAYNVFKNVQLSFAHGILNSILVLGIFPFYENLFGVTTRFKLLELSDLNAKIFKRMLINAPGTYNHSLVVANMAEAACEAIGANPILARVGGYYHDIGKINNARYFVENRPNDSPEADLDPEEYTRLIISHVETGVQIAKENKLPDSIIDFIRQHHGTSTMTYFYHQALEMAENSGETLINKEDFKYPGPKPQNRETAVVMIADSVEAASRSIQEPTSIKLEGLVKKIIYNKLNDGELENSNLNMSDLNLIQKSILRVLNGIFHTRLEYPEHEDVKKLEEKVLSSPEDEDQSL